MLIIVGINSAAMNVCFQIDGNDLREVEHQKAVQFFHASGEAVVLLVERGAEKRIKVCTMWKYPHVILYSNVSHYS